MKELCPLKLSILSEKTRHSNWSFPNGIVRQQNGRWHRRQNKFALGLGADLDKSEISVRGAWRSAVSPISIGFWFIVAFENTAATLGRFSVGGVSAAAISLLGTGMIYLPIPHFADALPMLLCRSIEKPFKLIITTGLLMPE